MTTALWLIVLALVSWLIYLGYSAITRWLHRRWRDGDDPIKRAYAAQLAAVDQIASLASAAVVFIVAAVVVLSGMFWAPLLAGLLVGALIAWWEMRRFKEITE